MRDLDVIAGAVSIPTLPVASTRRAVESAVTTPLEQQINGAEGMRYLQSTSGSDGTSLITATFDVGRDKDLAAVDMQNRVNTALPRLPAEVRNTGVVITKTTPAIVIAAGFYSKDGSLGNVFISVIAEIEPRGNRCAPSKSPFPRRGTSSQRGELPVVYAVVGTADYRQRRSAAPGRRVRLRVRTKTATAAMGTTRPAPHRDRRRVQSGAGAATGGATEQPALESPGHWGTNPLAGSKTQLTGEDCVGGYAAQIPLTSSAASADGAPAAVNAPKIVDT